MALDDAEGGFLFLDPDGVLAEALADRIPVKDTQRVLYLDLSDIEHPAGFNVLDRVPSDDRHRVARDILALRETLFPAGANTLTRARSKLLLHNAVRLLLDAPDSTALGILTVISDTVYRTRCLLSSSDPFVRKFWEEDFAAWDPKDRQAGVLDVQTTLGALVEAPAVRNMLGQRHSTFSLTKPGKIVIVNLNRAAFGNAEALLIGCLLLSRSTARTYIAGTGFFPPAFLSDLLPQRRFTLDFPALPRDAGLRAGLLTTCDIRAYQLTIEDTEEIAFRRGLMSPRIRSDVLTPEVSGEAPPNLRRLKAIRRRSRACFTRPRTNVEREIARFLA